MVMTAKILQASEVIKTLGRNAHYTRRVVEIRCSACISLRRRRRSKLQGGGNPETVLRVYLKMCPAGFLTFEQGVAAEGCYSTMEKRSHLLVDISETLVGVSPPRSDEDYLLVSQ